MAFLLAVILVSIFAARSTERGVATTIQLLSLIVFESNRDGNAEIYALNVANGRQVRLTQNVASDSTPALSPDGSLVAFASNRRGNWDIFVLDIRTQAIRRLSRSSSPEFAPSWSPGGDLLAWESFTEAGSQIVLGDRFGKRQRSTSLSGENFAPTWSPTGQVAFVHGENGSFRIVVADVDGLDVLPPTTLTDGPGDFEPAWSRDGSFLAFIRRDSRGRYDLWVRDLARAGEKRVTSNSAVETTPVFSPDDSDILYAVGSGRVWRIGLRPWIVRLPFPRFGALSILTPRGEDIRRPNASIAPDWGRARAAGVLRSLDGSRTPQALACTMVATSAGEILVGTDRADVLCGRAGNDALYGRRGNDVLDGGAGRDMIYGQRGSDVIYGVAGTPNDDDSIFGGPPVRSSGDIAWIDHGRDTVRGVEIRRPP